MLVCLAVLRLSTSVAGDVPPSALPVTLEWKAPRECPGQQDVAATMSSLLRDGLPAATSPVLAVRALVARRGARMYMLRLTFGSARGRQTRVLRADDCEPLARATALLTALRLDPSGVGRIARPDDLAVDEPAPDGPALSPAGDSSPDVPPSLAQPPDSVPPFSEPTIAAPVQSARAGNEPAPSILDVVDPPEPPTASGPVEPPRTRPRLAGHVRLEGGFDYGVLPGFGGDVGGAGGLAIRGVRLELGMLAVPWRIGRSAGAAARFDRLVAAIRVCPGWRVPRGVTLFACLGLEAGAIRAEGTQGVARPRVPWAPWSAVLLGAAARWAVVGPLGLWLGAEGVGALIRPEFTVGPDDRPLFRARPLGVRVNVGVDLQFPARRR